MEKRTTEAWVSEESYKGESVIRLINHGMTVAVIIAIVLPGAFF